jgi:hypothetical protein
LQIFGFGHKDEFFETIANADWRIVMKTRTTVMGALIASFCIAVPSLGWAQNNPTGLLKAGGVDDEAVALAYYATIDPGNARLTQTAWKLENGFYAVGNREIVAKGYFNSGDLGFYRSIHMVRDKRQGYRGNIAFTTVNYGSEQDANAEKNALSIVNMEYSPGPDGDGERIVKFYVYATANDPDYADGERKTHTAFTPESEELYLPAACFSCHGGDDDAQSPIDSYGEGSGETNATFLAFDVHTMTFGTPSRASLERKFKKFNKAVLRTNPTKATKALIRGLYGGSRLPNATQSEYVPSSWADGGEDEQLYTEVIVPACRLCHTTSDTKLQSLEWWEGNASSIREVVFHEETMPNSPNAYYELFWKDGSDMPDILGDWLDAH